MVYPVKANWVSIDVAGQAMEAYWAHPDVPGTWPAVLVFMEIFGVNRHIREVTEGIAAEGYCALAINYYHRTTRNLELGYSEAEVAMGRSHKDQTTRDGILSDVRAALNFIKRQDIVAPKEQVGTIGFCFGGHVAYLAAVLPEICATASFYGGGIAAFSPGGGEPTLSYTDQIHGRILCFFGDQDPLIPLTQTVEIEKALQKYQIDHTVVRYPEAGHGFFCNQREDFEPHAAQDAWERVKALFSETLKR